MNSNLIMTVVIVVLIVFIGLILWIQSKRAKISPDHQKRIKNHWDKIGKINDPKHAILEADKLLDEALTIKGLKGTFGDKLKANGGLFSDVNGIWAAHKLRNRVAHELDPNIAPHETKKALSQFKRALNDLGFNI